MTGFLDRMFSLNRELSIWVEEEELGTEKSINHGRRGYLVKIPKEIDRKATLRLRGLGKTRFRRTGDLLLHVWLNKGEDLTKCLWLSETSARAGAEKKLFTGDKSIEVVIPRSSHNGLTLRLRGLGRGPTHDRRAPALAREKRGDLFVKLLVFPDTITPKYGSFEALSTEHMALEGWVYRRFDEAIRKLGESSLPASPIPASAIADLFNEKGWTSIFGALVDHVRLNRLRIDLTTSASTATPGSCERKPVLYNNKVVGYSYKIAINEQFLDHPFSIAAILAHELSHVLYSEKIDETPRSAGYVIKPLEATLEEERMVDLLVFMFKMGEFQLRVARDKRLTLGYFNQEIFERIQVIVAGKLGLP